MDQFDRTKKMLGEYNVNLLKNNTILVVGIGGVGGIALEMLARSGIENIIIVDFDAFEETNLNRQILSTKENIGQLKVSVAKRRIKDINPFCNVKIYNIRLGNKIDFLEEKVDYIIDACDDIRAKVALVKYSISNNIKIISCCGTGNRINPSMLTISNIWKTKNDPLARKFRYELRKENIKCKFPVVCSDEIPIIKTKGAVGSMAMVPNAAGILLASYVINDIIMNN